MKEENEDKTMKVQQQYWRTWWPVLACVLLTSAGLYGWLVFTDASFINFLLFALTLGCPLVAGVVWWLYGKKL